MKLIKEVNFTRNLERIVLYIADDSKSRARTFSRNLQKQLNHLENFPYKFRKSVYFDNEHIRDYIFKGYTIPYLIDEENDVIVVLDIFKWVER